MDASEKRSKGEVEGTMVAVTPTASKESRPPVSRLDGEAYIRGFSFASALGIAFSILNSPIAMSASMNLVLPSGGPNAMIFGLFISTAGSLAIAASLAEICAIYPTSGGPYHWSAKLAPPRYQAPISWVAGWFACSGWWALSASAGSLAGTFLTGIYSLLHPDYTVQRYQIFIVYIGWALMAYFVNVFGVKALPFFNKGALFWSLTGLTIVSIVCLARASPNYQSAEFVFTKIINETGWPSTSVAWILGLLQSSFGLTGFDAVTHLTDEMPDPHIHAPRVMVLAVVIGAVSSFCFFLVLLFCLTDINAVNTSGAGPLLEIFYQATRSKTAAITLLLCTSTMCLVFAGLGILTSSSRMTQAFARDKGLPFHRILSAVSPRLHVPVASLTFVTVLVIVFGLIYLGSSAAMNAIISSSVVALNISYTIPILLVLLRGRHVLQRPEDDDETPLFSLGPVFGPVVNLFAVGFAAFTTVFFLFPPEYPVTASNMNYTVVLFGIIAAASAGTWVLGGSKTFEGPSNMDELLEIARRARTTPRSKRVV